MLQTMLQTMLVYEPGIEAVEVHLHPGKWSWWGFEKGIPWDSGVNISVLSIYYKYESLQYLICMII